jgi:hypothetical protein
MGKFATRIVVLLAAAFSLAAGGANAAVEGSLAQTAEISPDSPWPVRFAAGEAEFVIYPPQFDEWNAETLRGRAAVSVQAAGAERPSFGTAWLSARTRRDAALVEVRDITVEKVDFPAASQHDADFLTALRGQLQTKSYRVSAQRLQSDLAINRQVARDEGAGLRNDPPHFIFSERPAILVPIDGSPVLREVEGTQLLRVVNTRAMLLLDKLRGRYYLYAAGRWMSASALEGAWTQSNEATGELDHARQIAQQNADIDLLDDAEASEAAPVVYVSTTPTELLQSEGVPEYSPLAGTQLLYVRNSPDNIFLDLRSQRYYVLASGRWYRTDALASGRWEFVPGSALPADFANIPAEHPMAAVRAAVPGTPPAQEAVIANEAPQVATIRREAARLDLTYDGEPQFRPIEKTSLHYAANAPIPVIRVSADSYYALDNGVWFTARSPYGTWVVAAYVPAVIYTIPASSPLHYVTYVRIYHDTPDTVDVGYTAGYVGSYVSSGTVVYGTGWYYTPWVGYYWYGYPYTWGYGFSFSYSWWYPCCGPYYPAWRPYPCYRPWWGQEHPRWSEQGRRSGCAGPGFERSAHLRSLGRQRPRASSRERAKIGCRRTARRQRLHRQRWPQIRPAVQFAARTTGFPPARRSAGFATQRSPTLAARPPAHWTECKPRAARRSRPPAATAARSARTRRGAANAESQRV